MVSVGLGVKIFIHVLLALIFIAFSLAILANIVADFKRRKPYTVIMMFLCLSDMIGGINLVSHAALDDKDLLVTSFCSITVYISRLTILATGMLVTLMALERMLGLEFCFWYDQHVTTHRVLVVTLVTLTMSCAVASTTFVGSGFFSKRPLPPSPSLSQDNVTTTAPNTIQSPTTTSQPASDITTLTSYVNVTTMTSHVNVTNISASEQEQFCRAFPFWPQAGREGLFMRMFACVIIVIVLLNLTCNCVTFKGLWRMRSRVTALGTSSMAVEENSVRRLILVLSLAFIVTTIPACVYSVQTALGLQPKEWFRACAVFLISSTYVLDPVIYLVLTPRYRHRTWNFVLVKILRRPPQHVSPSNGQVTASSRGLTTIGSSRLYSHSTDQSSSDPPPYRPHTPLPQGPSGTDVSFGGDLCFNSSDVMDPYLPDLVHQDVHVTEDMEATWSCSGGQRG